MLKFLEAEPVPGFEVPGGFRKLRKTFGLVKVFSGILGICVMFYSIDLSDYTGVIQVLFAIIMLQEKQI